MAKVDVEPGMAICAPKAAPRIEREREREVGQKKELWGQATEHSGKNKKRNHNLS